MKPQPPNARYLRYPERHRRTREALAEAWERAQMPAADPGLRDVYAQIFRAPIRILACPLGKDVNQGGLLRLADAFRIEYVSFSPEPDDAYDCAGHRGAKVTQPHGWTPVRDAVAQAKSDGYQCVAVTLSERTVSFDVFEYSYPLALVMGEEKDGLPADVEAMCDGAVAIALYGQMMSLNVSTAAAIVLQHAVARYAAVTPDFQPVRNASRRLRGLAPVSYED